MSQEEIYINGELLRLRREAQGWVLNDMATRACMSVKQIRQLEEGGMSSFYSVAVKATAAKKVGALLGLSAEEVFSHDAAPTNIDTMVEAEPEAADVVAESVVVSHEDQVTTEPAPVKFEIESEKVEAPVSSQFESTDSKDETPSSKNALWLIALLLGIALAVGVYFQPTEEAVVEPPPPLQVLPADAVDPASAASAAEESASSSEVVIAPASAASAPVSQKPMPLQTSGAVTASTQATPVSSAPRLSASVPVIAPSVRASSSPVLAVPATSSASKAP